MTNVYVFPLAGSSFECLSIEAQRPPNESSATNDEGEQEIRNLDENDNESLSGVKKKETDCQPSDACRSKGKDKNEVDELHQTAENKSPNVLESIITGIHYYKEVSNDVLYLV